MPLGNDHPLPPRHVLAAEGKYVTAKDGSVVLSTDAVQLLKE